jgi:hypothetical protein
VGTKYVTNPAVGFGSNSPPDDGTQVAANLITWAGVKTKLADPVHVQADGIDSKLVTALDLSARAISSPDIAIASDHWKTLQVTGATTITLSSAASMGAGYEVGVFNAGVGVVTVTPGAAADTINGLSASVTVSIKGTKIFRTNQALTGYNVVGGYDPQTVTATTSVITSLIGTATDNAFDLQIQSVSRWQIQPNASNYDLWPSFGDGTQSFGRPAARIKQIFTPIIDTGTTGSGTLKTNNGTTVLTWANTGAVGWGTGIANFGTITKRKTADESVTSSTVLQDDDHLTHAIGANEEWVDDYFIDGGGALSTAGVKVAITVPSGATMNATVTVSGPGTISTARGTTSGTAIFATTASNDSDIRVSLWVLNGATPGNVTLQWAQNSSNVSAITFRKGSHMQATRVA